MICVFEISSSEAPDFKRLIQISPDHTFEELHQVIQNTSNFDNSQLASFFVTDEYWKKQIEIGLLDSGEKKSSVLKMRKVTIREAVEKSLKKLIYVFDFFNERFFYVELKDIIMKNDLKEPFVAYERGNAPVQFLVSDYDSPEVDLLDQNESYRSFGDLEDYYEIYGEMDA